MKLALSTTIKCRPVVSQRLKLRSADLLGMNATHAMIGGATHSFPGTLTVAENSSATAINIPTPTTDRFPIDQVTINTLPTNGVVTLADGVTVVTVGQNVGLDGLIGLKFTPTPGLFSSSSSLSYTVADIINESSDATETIVIGPQLAPAAPTVVGIASASDTGAVGDLLTSVTQPIVTGTGVTGDTVSLFDGTNVTPIGTAVVVNGTWSITPTVALADGPHTLTATQTSLSNAVSAVSVGVALTIDTSVPSAPISLTLAAGSDSGLQGDDLTSATLPVITGTGVAGDVVTLHDTDGITVIGTATVDGAGAWSVTPAAALINGLHSLTATQANPAGTISPASASLALTIDTSVPSAPISLTLDPGSDSGVQGDALTNVTQPAITGTGVAGDIVTLYDTDGITVVGRATVDGDGAWSVTPTAALADGTHTLAATITDPAGTTSPRSDPLVLTIDTAIPATAFGLTLAPGSDSGIAGDGLTNVSQPAIAGTGVAGDIVTLYDTDGITVIGSATVDGDGAWSVTPTAALADGAHSLTATITDPAGTTSPRSDPLVLTIDTAIPATPGLALTPASDSGTPGDGITNITTPSVFGTGVPGDTISLFNGSIQVGTATVTGDGTWTAITRILADGALTATETDAAGNRSTPSVALIIDTTAPPAPGDLALAVASDSGIQGDNLTNVTEPVLTGIAEPGSTISLYDGTIAVGTARADARTGIWSIPVTTSLGEGPNNFTATSTDAAGNTSTVSGAFTVTLDTTAPAVTASLAANPLDANADGIIYNQIVTGGGDPNVLVTISDGGQDIGTAQADATGAWSFDSSSLAQGAHTLVASETDAAGNTGSSAIPLTVPDPRFSLTNVTSLASGAFVGSDYTGPVSYLQAQYGYSGSDNIVIRANVANVFIYGGSGEDALAVKAGSNVLDGGTGSNWLVGASGADGGTDTFFVDGRGGQNTWDTLLNFHPGDMLTLWGFNAATSTTSWTDNQGAPNYLGATLKADFGGGTSALVTFDGLSTSAAKFTTSTGSSGGVNYLEITRTA